jgi:hypothetical protein
MILSLVRFLKITKDTGNDNMSTIYDAARQYIKDGLKVSNWLENMSTPNLQKLITDAEYIIKKRKQKCDHRYKYIGIGDPSIGGSMFSERYECVKCGNEQPVCNHK